MGTSNRRSFLHSLGLLSATGILSGFSKPAWSRNLNRAIEQSGSRTARDLAGDEDFWYYVQESFTASPSIINLNNGGISPAPKIVQDAMKRYMDITMEAPSYYMWRILDQGREPLRKNLARIAGCLPEEIAMNRNASEALETVIYGLDLKAGDEVVLEQTGLSQYDQCLEAEGNQGRDKVGMDKSGAAQ
jgi:hypothetical protein